VSWFGGRYERANALEASMVVKHISAIIDKSDKLYGHAHWLVKVWCLVTLALMSLLTAMPTSVASAPVRGFDSRLRRYPLPDRCEWLFRDTQLGKPACQTKLAV